MGRAVHQRHPELPFQPLQPLAQRGLDDVLACGGPTEMQLLGEGDEVAQLPKLHVAHPRSVPPRSHATAADHCLSAHGDDCRSRRSSLIIWSDERCTCCSFRPMRRREFAVDVDREDVGCHPSGPAAIAPEPRARAFTEPPASLSSRPPPRVHGAGNAGNGGSRCGCACPAAGSPAQTTPRTSTPEPTTRRPTTPSPSAIRAAHTRGGAMSTNEQSEQDRRMAGHPSASFNRRRDASISASAAARPAQDAPSTLLPGSSSL